MKILNLYSGIGGNRKLWGDAHEITAVELNPEIAAIYKDIFQNDTVIVADAHQYLLDHYKEFDFIWSSPPCQSHSRTNYYIVPNGTPRYPDMKLYEEIIFLTQFFKGLFCVENVRGYYDPLIKPFLIDRHYFWTNFQISKIEVDIITIGAFCGKNQTEKRKQIEKVTSENFGFDLSQINIKHRKDQLLRNCVNPELGLHILDCALGKFNQPNPKQLQLL